MGAPVHAHDTTASVVLREGLLVAGKYLLGQPRGSGAMGTVWSATHRALGSAVAIKFLHGNGASSDDSKARFAREARIAARLSETSRHIARVDDYGTLEDGTPFLVMELLQGEDLAARLRREPRLPLLMVAKIVSQLSRALEAAHASGVIHRDLKPANIFLADCVAAGAAPFEDDEFTVKLMDFGVAKATMEADDDQSTVAGMLIGTPGYMSPEQILAQPLDARSDLWGLAACIYRMVVGQSPFGQGGLSELGVRILAADPEAPSSIDPSLPPELDGFFERALAKDRDHRFGSARELARSLNELVGVHHDVEAFPLTGRRALAPQISRIVRRKTARSRLLPMFVLSMFVAGAALAAAVGARPPARTKSAVGPSLPAPAARVSAAHVSVAPMEKNQPPAPISIAPSRGPASPPVELEFFQLALSRHAPRK